MCVHVKNLVFINLQMFVSAHYGGSDLVIKFDKGEQWKKVFGPVFMYINSNSKGEDPRTLWKDAKNQVYIVPLVPCVCIFFPER